MSLRLQRRYRKQITYFRPIWTVPDCWANTITGTADRRDTPRLIADDSIKHTGGGNGGPKAGSELR